MKRLVVTMMMITCKDMTTVFWGEIIEEKLRKVPRNTRNARACRKLELYLCVCGALQNSKAGFKLLIVPRERKFLQRKGQSIGWEDTMTFDSKSGRWCMHDILSWSGERGSQCWGWNRRVDNMRLVASCKLCLRAAMIKWGDAWWGIDSVVEIL